MDYLIHRDVSVGLTFSYVMTGTTRSFSSTDEANQPLRMFDGASVKGESAGLVFKFFRFRHSSSIPPIGMYKTISLQVTRANTYDHFNSKEKILLEDVVAPVLGFGIGRQTIVARNLLLKTGVEFGFAIVPYHFLTESADDWSAEQFTTYRLHQSIFSYHLFNFSVGLGYIPF
jgi:hypothetical protein